MNRDHNNRTINNDLQWDSGNFVNAQAQSTPEDPIPATSQENGGVASTMNAAVAATTPLCSAIKREEETAAAAEGGVAADFTFIPGAFYPGQWWTPNIPFTMDDQPWANMNYNPFTAVGAQITQHPFDPFPSAPVSGGFPCTMTTTATNSFPSYDVISPNIGYFPTMSLLTAGVTKPSPTNKRRASAPSSAPDLPENLPYKTGRGTNDVRVRTADNYRRVYTDYIRIELEKEYHMNQFITPVRKADLAEKLNLTERQIKIWFQNRRAKKRKEDPR